MCPQCTPISVKIVAGRFVTVYPPVPPAPDDITFYQMVHTPKSRPNLESNFGFFGYIQCHEDHA